MGTRGITEVIYNNDIKVSQYGQWDHYPSGQGVVVFEFLRKAGNIDKLKTNLSLLFEPSKDELDKIYADFTDDSGWMTLDDGKKFGEMYPSLTRDTGAGILEVIANATDRLPIVKDPDFKNDELFCEGIFTVDLDQDVFITKYADTTTVIPFSEIYNIGSEDYLIRSNCPVYKYEQENKVLDNTAVA